MSRKIGKIKKASTKEWAVHLREDGKKDANGRIRRISKEEIKDDIRDFEHD